MFKSATLRLTGWYLLILLSISVIFSITIYNIVTSEVGDRLRQLQVQYEHPDMQSPIEGLQPRYDRYSDLRIAQRQEADKNILFALIYVNFLILFGGGAISYWLARRTLHDIEVVHEAQSRFTSDASHELRTPLAAMKAELEVALRDKKISKDDMREILESNLEEVEKLSRLSQMLLQLSKTEYSKLEMSQVSLKNITDEVSQRLDKNGTRIKINHSTLTTDITANQASIEELVMILTDNAIKYSPEKSLITMTLSKRAGKACFEITNTGTGISPADLPHIFDRFYRADSSRTGGQKSGYGLGLSLAKKIVEIHHGELSASSALNHATTFTVLLPVFKSKEARS
ncbi:MAG: GHKL domain-containing protein [Chloroflexi bacterium]|nr:MAG: GHKL domain-containing protein [Chloroflexota bacterium]